MKRALPRSCFARPCRCAGKVDTKKEAEDFDRSATWLLAPSGSLLGWCWPSCPRFLILGSLGALRAMDLSTGLIWGQLVLVAATCRDLQTMAIHVQQSMLELGHSLRFPENQGNCNRIQDMLTSPKSWRVQFDRSTLTLPFVFPARAPVILFRYFVGVLPTQKGSPFCMASGQGRVHMGTCF